MDPNTGKIYREDQIENLAQEIKDRLKPGDLEELKVLQREIDYQKALQFGNRATRRRRDKEKY